MDVGEDTATRNLLWFLIMVNERSLDVRSFVRSFVRSRGLVHCVVRVVLGIIINLDALNAFSVPIYCSN